jgi:hypothetical protein
LINIELREVSMGEQVYEEAKKAYDTLSSFANGYRNYGKLLGEELIHDHKLLQAYVVGIMLDMIRVMADNGDITLQNRRAVECCQGIVAALGPNPQYL